MHRLSEFPKVGKTLQDFRSGDLPDFTKQPLYQTEYIVNLWHMINYQKYGGHMKNG